MVMRITINYKKGVNMKRFNKISILVLALSLALVACGKGNMESQKETVK